MARNKNKNKNKNKNRNKNKNSFGRGQRKNLSKAEFRANMGIGKNNTGANNSEQAVPATQADQQVVEMQKTIDQLTQQFQEANTQYNQDFNNQRNDYENRLSETENRYAEMQDKLMGTMNSAAYRNPVLGVRFAGQNKLNRPSLNSAFGRMGARLAGVMNTSLNLK